MDVSLRESIDRSIENGEGVLLEVLSSVSKKLIGINIQREHLIEECLREIGLGTGVSRAYICLFKDDLSCIDEVYEWHSQDVSSEKKKLKGLSTDVISWWMGKLSWNEMISIESPMDIPKQAEVEREILAEHRVKSVLVTPIYYRKCLVGYIGLDEVFKNRVWSREYKFFAKLISSKLASAIEKIKIDRRKAQRWEEENDHKLKTSILESKIAYNLEDLNDVFASVLDNMSFDIDVFNDIKLNFSREVSNIRCNKAELAYLFSKVLEKSIEGARRKICCLEDGQDRVYNYLGIKTYGEDGYAVCKIVDNGTDISSGLNESIVSSGREILNSHCGEIFFDRNYLSENEVIIKLPLTL